VTLQCVGGGKALAADLRVQGTSSTRGALERYHAIPSLHNRDHFEGACTFLSLEMLHKRLGHH
jgi:hypothetical protein